MRGVLDARQFLRFGMQPSPFSSLFVGFDAFEDFLRAFFIAGDGVDDLVEEVGEVDVGDAFVIGKNFGRCAAEEHFESIEFEPEQVRL